MKIDAFIPCAPKDLFRIKLVIKYMLENIKEINDIHICTPTKITPIAIDTPIYYHLDFDILPNVQPFNWKFRPNWIYQQFIKLFQNVTNTEYYFTLDADTLIIKKLPLFENNKPIWYRGYDQTDGITDNIPICPQYRAFNNIFFPNYDPTLHKHTFISDMNLFNKKFINEIMNYINLTPSQLIEKSYKITSVKCHIAEPEFYGYFIFKKYPDYYIYKKINQKQSGKLQYNPYDCNWTQQEVKNIIENAKNENYDVISMHSWCIPSHNWNDNTINLI
jgi:hypothetical protein